MHPQPSKACAKDMTRYRCLRSGLGETTILRRQRLDLGHERALLGIQEALVRRHPR